MCFAPQRRALFQHLNFQSGLRPSVSYTFDFEMCFAPQRRALFHHLNFQKCSENGVPCTFWLRDVLRATQHALFHHLEWCALYVLTSKCASRHNSVQSFISHLARWLRTRRFSEPTFRPSGATNHWKNTVFSDFFYLFAHLHLLSSDSFSSMIFFLLLFSSLTLPTSAFPSVHIVGSLTSKLPSMMCVHIIYIYMRQSKALGKTCTDVYRYVFKNLYISNFSICIYVLQYDVLEREGERERERDLKHVNT